MNCKELKLQSLLLAGAMAITPAAWAEAFIGVSFGKSSVDESIAEGLITSGTVDGKDSGVKVFGGANINKNFGLELAYVDLGTTTYSGSFGGSPVTGGKVDISGLNFGLVATFPVSPTSSMVGRLGMYSWEAEASDTTGGVPFSATADGTDLSFGLGAQFDFSKNVGMRMEWERFDLDGVDADLLSLGVVWKFGN